MRGLIISIVLFSVMLITILINAFFIHSSSKNMSKEIESLNPIPCQSNQIIIDKFSQEWERKGIWIGLSVSNEDMQKLTNAIDELKIANANEDTTQFQIYLSLLLNAIDEIGRLEKFSIKNIL